jgi:hypothetical protein
MTLFAHRFAERDPGATIRVPGRYDASRALRVDRSGVPVVRQPGPTQPWTGTKATRDPDGSKARRSFAVVRETAKAGRDRPQNALVDTGTRGGRDRDAYAVLLTTRTAAGRDQDAAARNFVGHRRGACRPSSPARADV